ncbi:hypothetical protein [uncultured Pseudokineococcus sp.]|uniref:hypothetical protein n=1 Tax=uncultured Pseudokineococcus sp. TaxID=1642928 RepID=UPI002605AC7A|nr:hypothetical protein [uncultured Pseudokineococcus sp.]
MASSRAARATLEHSASAALDDMDCAVCGRSVPHELVDCVDGHEQDCPDRVCTACGSILVVGPSPLELLRSA